MAKKKPENEMIDPIPDEEPEAETIIEEAADEDVIEDVPEPEPETIDEPVQEPVVKAGGHKVRVRGFFGLFKNARFVNDDMDEWGVAERVSDETLELLRQDYPAAEIEVLD